MFSYTVILHPTQLYFFIWGATLQYIVRLHCKTTLQYIVRLHFHALPSNICRLHSPLHFTQLFFISRATLQESCNKTTLHAAFFTVLHRLVCYIARMQGCLWRRAGARIPDINRWEIKHAKLFPGNKSWMTSQTHASICGRSSKYM